KIMAAADGNRNQIHHDAKTGNFLDSQPAPSPAGWPTTCQNSARPLYMAINSGGTTIKNPPGITRRARKLERNEVTG
ncbi:MAG: hypothetical protein ACKO02_01610, partial [Cyanobium sp.]